MNGSTVTDFVLLNNLLFFVCVIVCVQQLRWAWILLHKFKIQDTFSLVFEKLQQTTLAHAQGL